MLYEFAGGALVAVVVMIGVALLVALDPDTYRRAKLLQEVWTILVAYLAVGPLVGWLASQERERQLQLTATTHRLDMVQEIIQAINNSVDPQETLQAIIAETRHSSSPYLGGVRPRDIAVNKAYQCEQGQNYTMIVSEVVLLATISWSVWSIDNLLGIF